MIVKTVLKIEVARIVDNLISMIASISGQRRGRILVVVVAGRLFEIPCGSVDGRRNESPRLIHETVSCTMFQELLCFILFSPRMYLLEKLLNV